MVNTVENGNYFGAYLIRHSIVIQWSFDSHLVVIRLSFMVISPIPRNP